MLLLNVYEAVFLERKNRFVGEWLLQWQKVLFHIWDTGRLKELLFEWNRILIQKLEYWKRKYNWRLVWVKWLLWNFILINSLLHSALVREYLSNRKVKFIPEVKVWDSKIDFLINNKIYVEVKGCSLIENINWKWVWMFPDAPTARGLKHLRELISLIKNWIQAEIWFLLTNDVNYFSPNFKTHNEFAELFYEFLKLWWKVRFLAVRLDFHKNIKQANISLLDKKVDILKIDKNYN